MLVLLIACTNIAGMMVARGASNRHDLGVRLALGAGRWQVARPVVEELVWVGVCGGLLGIALAYGGVAVLLRLIRWRCHRGSRLRWTGRCCCSGWG